MSGQPGPTAAPLAKVASGGELARLSLAVQVAVFCQRRAAAWCSTRSIPASVARWPRWSGGSSRRWDLRGQAMCVTHLPQVASQVTTCACPSSSLTARRAPRIELTMDERVEELARMLGGTQSRRDARTRAGNAASRRTDKAARNARPATPRSRRAR